MEDIPEDVLEKLKSFNETLTQFEDSLDEFLQIPYSDQTERPPLEKARLDLSTIYSLNSLYWAYISCMGKNPKDQEDLSTELKRIKEYMLKFKNFEDQHLRPQINQKGAKAFVRNALFDVNAESSLKRELKQNDEESEVKKSKTLN